jgi:hypothetical protein
VHRNSVSVERLSDLLYKARLALLMLEGPGGDYVYVKKIMQVVDESVVMGMERERATGPRAWGEAFYCLGCSDYPLGAQFGWVGVV